LTLAVTQDSLKDIWIMPKVYNGMVGRSIDCTEYQLDNDGFLMDNRVDNHVQIVMAVAARRRHHSIPGRVSLSDGCANRIFS